MGDENPIRTLGDFSKASHEGYRNTIELPIGLVQNGCSFHRLRILHGFLKNRFNQPYREGGAQKKGNQKPIKAILPKVPLPHIHNRTKQEPISPKMRSFHPFIRHPHKKEVEEVIDEEESEVETDEEVEEILKDEEEDEDGESFNSFPTIEELTHHEWLLNNPRPPWVKARIRAKSLNNIKISFMIRHFFKRHAYIDLESPINIMSRRQYNQIMAYGLRSRQKLSNLDKVSNFVGRVRSLKIFIGSFAYECDFMILEDTTSIIDRHLGEMAFGRPFIDETSLVYNREEETVMFKQDDEKITFKMPHTMQIFKQI
nr:protein kinase-like domain, concanavalin A-like lectin/glucanase domain protein [Tanacetum cinerariifolium]